MRQSKSKRAWNKHLIGNLKRKDKCENVAFDWSKSDWNNSGSFKWNENYYYWQSSEFERSNDANRVVHRSWVLGIPDTYNVLRADTHLLFDCGLSNSIEHSESKSFRGFKMQSFFFVFFSFEKIKKRKQKLYERWKTYVWFLPQQILWNLIYNQCSIFITFMCAAHIETHSCLK